MWAGETGITPGRVLGPGLQVTSCSIGQNQRMSLPTCTADWEGSLAGCQEKEDLAFVGRWPSLPCPVWTWSRAISLKKCHFRGDSASLQATRSPGGRADRAPTLFPESHGAQQLQMRIAPLGPKWRLLPGRKAPSLYFQPVHGGPVGLSGENPDDPLQEF